MAIDNASQILKTPVGLSRGDYAVVQITEARGHTLKGQALWRSSIVGFNELMSSPIGSSLDVSLLTESIQKQQLNY
jgi:hypothetical protein